MSFDLKGHCIRYADRVAVEGEDFAITYWDFFELIVTKAKKLAPVPIDVPIVSLGKKSLDTWILILAAHYAGKTVVPVDKKFKIEDVRAYLGQKELISIDDLDRLPEDNLQSHKRSKKWICLFTSGSASKPKGVVHSFDSLKDSAKASNNFYKFQAGDSWLLSLGIYHIAGIMIALRTFMGGGRLYLPPMGGELLSLIASEKFDFISLVPTQLHDLIKSDQCLENLRRAKSILIGGSSCPDWLYLRCLENNLPISLTYGSSEAGAQVSATIPGSKPKKNNHVGKIIPGREVVIINERIAIGPSGRFLSYWNEESLDGFFISQDLGRIEGDDLYVTGRCDRVFQSGGENISPEEIERICQGIVSDGLCVVVPGQDQRLGFVPFLIVISKVMPDFKDLLVKLDKRLPTFKRPRKVFWDRSLPASGKVQFKGYLSEEKLISLHLLWDYYG